MLRKNRKIFQNIIYFLKLDTILGFLGRRHILMRLVYFLAPDPEFYPFGTLRKISFRGLKFHVKMYDLPSWANYFGFFTEDIDCLKQIAHKTDVTKVILDIGANNGRWALLVSNFFEFSKIECFEPFPDTFEFLKKNIDLNKISKNNIEVNNFALGSKVGQFFMESDHIKNSGMNKISNQKSDFQISVNTVDTFLSHQINSDVSVIKIDVEGFEMEVLLGAKAVIEKSSPTIVCEVDDSLLSKNGSSPLEVFTFLEGFGYKIYKLPKFELVNSKETFKNIHIDIIALK